ncbi:hypothetical protein M730_01915 [Neisseria gonorrhoeae ATL_2011_01-21]|nr:hypothetical protein M730_01915 [Neisseria gonorrhoeae ATL_2011_01-21]KLS83505.1 hypothetical protein M786_00900 [Neisseria gonorrhoeae MU_NG21]
MVFLLCIFMGFIFQTVDADLLKGRLKAINHF